MLRVPAEKVIFIYDEDNTIDVICAIRFFTVSELDGANRTITKTYVEVYTADDITYYFMTSSNEKKTTTIFLDTNKTLNPQPHIFGVVPLIDFPNNEEELSDLAKIESLVDDYDRILSDASNEQEAYRNAYLMIKNMIMNTDTLEKLRQEGIIEVDDDGDVKFITKDIQATAIQAHLDRVSSNVFKFSNTPDLSDEKFAGNLSGVAIKFKMFGLETKCIIKERKMERALRRLLKVLSVPVQLDIGKKVEMADCELTFTRNLPANNTEIVDEVVKLNGIVDQETLLNLLPFIDKAKEVIDKLKKENDLYGINNGKYINPDNFTDSDNKVIPNPNDDETILPYISNSMLQGN
jgi:SPP1 family phage portal protein